MDPIVELKTGSIRGIVEKHEDGFNYYAFKGVPYAEQPIGQLRFEDPVPKKKWTGILDCKNYGPLCLQFDTVGMRESIDENCLHLDIFTHSINKENLRPVIVWLHGGNFMFGGSDDLYNGPEYLIRKNIVLVTVNYRLHVLGFLDLEDEIAPGNQGLKDQVMALQWVQQNIEAFGGHSNNVTVGGSSSGAICAHSLCLSPLSKGLFHKVISHGSVVYNKWSEVDNPRSNTIKLCSFLGKELVDSKEIVNFLKSVDNKELLEALKLLWFSARCMPFGPGVDSKSQNPFMPVYPDLIANDGVHLPYLVGHTQREGIFMLLDFKWMTVCNAHKTLEHYDLHVLQARKLYYKSEKIDLTNSKNFVDFLGDALFVEGVHRFARVQAERSSASTYFYQFSYDSPNSFSNCFINDTPGGVSHLDDHGYLFQPRILEKYGFASLKKGSKDYRIMEQMTEMWTNFAEYGRPTIETTDLIPVHWKPNTDGTLLRYLNIDEDLTMQFMVNIEQKYLAAKSIKI